MSQPLHLFEGFGVELEYMIVDARTLDVRPIADELLKAAAGEVVSGVDWPNGISWSNELVLHVIELKSTEPLPGLEGWAERFQESVRHANALLRPMGARLMPAAMHPWMDPQSEMKLWPHDYNAVYEQFNRIFDCRGHGWANLQSAHLNLPFCGDDEFGRLHAAIRVLLPLLPALAASSPIVEGRRTGFLDTRMEVYRKNSARIPSVAGLVVPETVFTQADYEAQILQRMYADVAPFDPDGILQDEFLNARGAIARFSRGSIEIRVLDVQEHPLADLSILALVVAVLRLLVEERLSAREDQQAITTELLEGILLRTIRDGDRAEIVEPGLLRLLGMPVNRSWPARDVWRSLFERCCRDGLLAEEFRPSLSVILEQGPLARRILAQCGPAPERVRLSKVYAALSDCLHEGRGMWRQVRKLAATIGSSLISAARDGCRAGRSVLRR